jgi:hypothetical protein
VTWGSDSVHLQKANMHTAASHEVDNRKYLSHRQRMAVQAAVRNAPNISPAELLHRSLQEDLSPSPLAAAAAPAHLASVRRMVNRARKAMAEAAPQPRHEEEAGCAAENRAAPATTAQTTTAAAPPTSAATLSPQAPAAANLSPTTTAYPPVTANPSPESGGGGGGGCSGDNVPTSLTPEDGGDGGGGGSGGRSDGGSDGGDDAVECLLCLSDPLLAAAAGRWFQCPEGHLL